MWIIVVYVSYITVALNVAGAGLWLDYRGQSKAKEGPWDIQYNLTITATGLWCFCWVLSISVCYVSVTIFSKVKVDQISYWNAFIIFVVNFRS